MVKRCFSSRLCLSPTPSTRSACFPPPTYSTGHPGRPPGTSSLAPRRINSTRPSVGGRSQHSSLFSRAFLRTPCQQSQKVYGIRLCPISGCVSKKKSSRHYLQIQTTTCSGWEPKEATSNFVVGERRANRRSSKPVPTHGPRDRRAFLARPGWRRPHTGPPPREAAAAWAGRARPPARARQARGAGARTGRAARGAGERSLRDRGCAVGREPGKGRRVVEPE